MACFYNCQETVDYNIFPAEKKYHIF